MRSIPELIAADPALAALRERVAPRLADDPGHDVAHAMRVASWARRIDPSLDAREVIAAALMHDAVNLAKDSPERAQASTRSAALARAWLPEHGFSPAAIERIAEAIEDHSYSRGATPRDALGRAIQDADRLEALGAIGTARTFITGVRLGGLPFDGADPWAERRDRDDRAFSVDHFFVKLLNLEATMTTAAGREEARRRSAFMREFLAQLGRELDVPLPDDGK
jgi:uncharacterized protein